MSVPILNLRAQYQELQAEIDEAIRSVLAGGHFVLGPNVRALEEEMARALGVARAVSVASGTDGLHLIFRALDVGPGDLVLTTPFTFIATATSVSYTGARPVFADITAGGFTLDPERAAECLAGRGPRGLPAGRVRALLPVHLYGQPADMEALTRLAAERGLAVVEDAAQAVGATYRGRSAGALGDAAAFSFYPTKNLGAMGDAGLVASTRPDLAERILRLRVYGGRERYVHEELG
ncbi:MAG: DegT/DnrJ/EryC1/StrS family aminotransferase, partial [Candidatus Methylomirabilales bacterium]